MKLKEIILDFTPLLDVIMILLFGFILNYHNQTADIKKKAESDMATAQSLSEEAEQKKAEADELYEELLTQKEELDNMLNEIKESDVRKAENIQGLNELNLGLNLKAKINVNEDEQKWCLVISQIDEKVAELEQNSISKDSFVSVFEQVGYKEDDTICFELLYSSEDVGTNTAVELIGEKLHEVKKEYKHLFVSYTDESIFLED